MSLLNASTCFATSPRVSNADQYSAMRADLHAVLALRSIFHVPSTGPVVGAGLRIATLKPSNADGWRRQLGGRLASLDSQPHHLQHMRHRH